MKEQTQAIQPSVRTYPCPCKMGQVVIQSTDQGETQYTLTCKACQHSHRVVVFTPRLPSFPMHTRLVRMVPTQTAERFERGQQEVRQLQLHILTHSKSKHLQTYLDHVMSSSSRTHIWRTLERTAGTPSRTLNEFRNYSLATIRTVVQNHFQLGRLRTILQRLSIQDPALLALLDRMDEVQEELERLEEHILTKGLVLQHGHNLTM